MGSKKLLKDSHFLQKRPNVRVNKNVQIVSNKGEISKNTISKLLNSDTRPVIDTNDKPIDPKSSTMVTQNGNEKLKITKSIKGEEMSEYEKLREKNISARKQIFEEMQKSAIIAGESMR